MWWFFDGDEEKVSFPVRRLQFLGSYSALVSAGKLKSLLNLPLNKEELERSLEDLCRADPNDKSTQKQITKALLVVILMLIESARFHNILNFTVNNYVGLKGHHNCRFREKFVWFVRHWTKTTTWILNEEWKTRMPITQSGLTLKVSEMAEIIAIGKIPNNYDK